jgi:hypothetical protein
LRRVVNAELQPGAGRNRSTWPLSPRFVVSSRDFGAAAAGSPEWLHANYSGGSRCSAWAHTGVVERKAGPENVVGMVLHAFGRSLLEDPLVTVAWMLLVSLAGVLGVLLVAIGVELVGRL